MRVFARVLSVAVFGCTLAGLASTPPQPAFAQSAQPQAGGPQAGTPQAGSQGGDEAPPQQIALTQNMIDGLVAAQAEMRPLEEKMSGDKPDPNVEAQMTGIAKKYGFASPADFGAASYSIGVVLAGMDPQTHQYVGPAAIINKQIAEVKADAKMPPKEKKEALDELTSALSASSADKPLPGNIELVGKNYEKLNAGVQQDAN